MMTSIQHVCNINTQAEPRGIILTCTVYTEAVHADTCSLLIGPKMSCCGTYPVSQNVLPGLEATSGFFLRTLSVIPACTNNKTSTAAYNGL